MGKAIGVQGETNDCLVFVVAAPGRATPPLVSSVISIAVSVAMVVFSEAILDEIVIQDSVK